MGVDRPPVEGLPSRAIAERSLEDWLAQAQDHPASRAGENDLAAAAAYAAAVDEILEPVVAGKDFVDLVAELAAGEFKPRPGYPHRYSRVDDARAAWEWYVLPQLDMMRRSDGPSAFRIASSIVRVLRTQGLPTEDWQGHVEEWLQQAGLTRYQAEQLAAPDPADPALAERMVGVPGGAFAVEVGTYLEAAEQGTLAGAGYVRPDAVLRADTPADQAAPRIVAVQDDPDMFVALLRPEGVYWHRHDWVAPTRMALATWADAYCCDPAKPFVPPYASQQAITDAARYGYPCDDCGSVTYPVTTRGRDHQTDTFNELLDRHVDACRGRVAERCQRRVEELEEAVAALQQAWPAAFATELSAVAGRLTTDRVAAVAEKAFAAVCGDTATAGQIGAGAPGVFHEVDSVPHPRLRLTGWDYDPALVLRDDYNPREIRRNGYPDGAICVTGEIPLPPVVAAPSVTPGGRYL